MCVNSTSSWLESTTESRNLVCARQVEQRVDRVGVRNYARAYRQLYGAGGAQQSIPCTAGDGGSTTALATVRGWLDDMRQPETAQTGAEGEVAVGHAFITLGWGAVEVPQKFDLGRPAAAGPG